MAAARELKKIDPQLKLVGVCEKNAKFAHLFEEEKAIDEVRQVRAGKFRRYSGEAWYKKLTDIKTAGLNTRDMGYVMAGYRQAYKLIKALKPDGVLIKGGFVGVPVGLAAARLGIPLITHDSDSIPGLANRIVSRWAVAHATGMPKEHYAYDATKTFFTGIPVAEEYGLVGEDYKKKLQAELGLSNCQQVITITGASQGAEQLNNDMVKISGRLMQRFASLGILHIAGPSHSKKVESQYHAELLTDETRRVVVKGFVGDMYRYTGAADVVISRASATVIAELALQAKPTVLVPGQLAGGHQEKNARSLQASGAAEVVKTGDSEDLLDKLSRLLQDNMRQQQLAKNLHQLAKPHAARELAALAYETFKKDK